MNTHWAKPTKVPQNRDPSGVDERETAEGACVIVIVRFVGKNVGAAPRGEG